MILMEKSGHFRQRALLFHLIKSVLQLACEREGRSIKSLLQVACERKERSIQRVLPDVCES
jgi:hypothetical protein